MIATTLGFLLVVLVTLGLLVATLVFVRNPGTDRRQLRARQRSTARFRAQTWPEPWA